MKFLLTLCFCFCVGQANAAGSGYSSDSNEDASGEGLTVVESAIEAKDYAGAIKLLDSLIKVDKRNADAWNLLGYANRKIDNVERSAEAYAKALEIDPKHKGALEYQGELFIMLGKRDDALTNLAKLKTLCPDGCEELEDLSEALKVL